MRIPQEVAGTGQEHPAQLVLLAMGFLGPEQDLLDALEIASDPNTTITAEYEQYQTSIPGVFAALATAGVARAAWSGLSTRGAGPRSSATAT